MTIDFGPAISDVAILSRLVFPDKDEISTEAAQAMLTIRFEQADLDRIHVLVVKGQDDKLSPRERTELENYRRVSFLLDLMHSKARQIIKSQQTAH